QGWGNQRRRGGRAGPSEKYAGESVAPWPNFVWRERRPPTKLGKTPDNRAEVARFARPTTRCAAIHLFHGGQHREAERRDALTGIVRLDRCQRDRGHGADAGRRVSSGQFGITYRGHA